MLSLRIQRAIIPQSLHNTLISMVMFDIVFYTLIIAMLLYIWYNDSNNTPKH